MAVELSQGDLPEGVRFGAAVAVDTETMGLNPHRDRLCLVQLSGGDGDCASRALRRRRSTRRRGSRRC